MSSGDLRHSTFDIGDEMKMQLRKILILPAIDDQTPGGQLEFIYKALDGCVEIGEEGCLRWIELY